MPKVNADGEGDRCGGGGTDVHRVKLIRAITSVKHHPRTGIDEHMSTYTTFQKSAQFSWKELLSRIKQTHDQVNANLSSYHNLEHMAALSSPLLLVKFRYHMEEIQQPMSS